MDHEVRAIEVEIGDVIVVEGAPHKVEGTYVDGNGRARILAAGRWRSYHRGDRIIRRD